ncbi:tellurite resistance TerB family protein [Pseudomonas sp. NW5]|uniref:tellurite resistance TerB family protein n=1 Tax=Pseudomonas sp. NW5 TaxID=2934934 RepID=UPI00202183DC|nr:tellurite resistance TerB family protein [Pseudomonas sp. NW5]MCL7462032.1 tellurite resistance TerB family protein [Pseudomonas sp. NW5]
MDTRSLLDQLLKAAPGLLGGNAKRSHRQPAAPAGQKDALGGLLSSAGGGALAGGLVSLLLGSKKARQYGGKALTYGGLAALGVMAWKAYGNWQKQQGAVAAQEPQTLDRLPAPLVEQHSHAILRALIAAAKSDGHIDDRERELIDAEVARLQGDAALLAWIDAELRRPLDPREVAQAATTPELAAEMFLASLLVIDEQSFMERAYLDELARQLRLDPALRVELEHQVREAS